jgi:hypothetical protein
MSIGHRQNEAALITAARSGAREFTSREPDLSSARRPVRAFDRLADASSGSLARKRRDRSGHPCDLPGLVGR